MPGRLTRCPLQQPGGGNDQTSADGDKAYQPEKVPIVAPEYFIEAFVHLLEALLDLLETPFDLLKALFHLLKTLAHQFPLVLESFLDPHHPLAEFDLVHHRGLGQGLFR